MTLIESLEKSLRKSFINHNESSLITLESTFLVNDEKRGKNFLSTLLYELNTCDEFWISVAFATTGGVAAIMNILEELTERGVKGKILVSQYLNFTHPEALKRLLQFNNIELKIAVNSSFHSKGYLFKKGDVFDVIIGSSNLTDTALKTNKEWNLKITTTQEGEIYNQIISEFQREFNLAIKVDIDFIEEYSKYWTKLDLSENKLIRIQDSVSHKVVPNKMQEAALKNLDELRKKGENKALLISATGTGKTYLSAFDVKNFKPNKFLFIVHRRNIAEKAMETFRSLLGSNISFGLYSGQNRQLNADYIFSTIQTLSRDGNLDEFSSDEFDYIVIDETHRAGADSYRKIINHFKPKFFLGMTATPERTDGDNIFELFDNNIASEIRLQEALSENMLSPFHYYGVTDLTINDELIDDHSDFNKLVSDIRVDHIISKSKFYGTDNGAIRGLIFCSTVKVAEALSNQFNQRGYKTIHLSGNSSEQERIEAINKLESDDESYKLDYVFTVDIFNEGIDIPKVNQIIMLRPTQSAIIFVQQLGRGLRKADNKEYLTVIDFIGNYQNNYLVPIALYGDKTYNKDTIRKLMVGGSDMIAGPSTINFDKISRERIFESISKAKLQTDRDLKIDYQYLKNMIGKIPMMMDFVNYEKRDPWQYVSKYKSYLHFLLKVEADNFQATSKNLKLLSLFSLEINNGKRVEESILLKLLIEEKSVLVSEFQNHIRDNYGYEIEQETIDSVIRNLNFEFVKKPKNIIQQKNSRISFQDQFIETLKDNLFKEFLLDSIEYSIMTFEKKLRNSFYSNGFILNEKYGRKDVCRILNWEEDIASTVYGYRTKNRTTPCFVTYKKDENLEGDINYNDHFIDNQHFAWESKSKRTLESKDVKNVISSNRILLFVKKDDAEGTDFYYLGDVSIVPGSVMQHKMQETGSPVVLFKFKLDHPVRHDLYEYFEKNTKIEPLNS